MAKPALRRGLWPALRPWCLCGAGLVPLFAAIYYLSVWVRYEGQVETEAWHAFTATVLWFVLTKLAVFAYFRIPRNWSDYVTFYDLLALVQAATISLLLLVLVNRFFLSGPLIPRSIFLLDWGATIVVVGGARSALRLAREKSWLWFFSKADMARTLIVGASEAGELLLRAIRCNPKNQYHVVGFLNNGDSTGTAPVGGVPVVGHVDRVAEIAARYQIDEVLIAADVLPGRRLRQLVEDVRCQGIAVKVLPSYGQWIAGRVSVQPRAVSIQDLLRREPVELDLQNIRQWIDGRTALVTGSAGSIGAEVCRQLLQFAPKRLVLVDRAESGQFFLEREVRELAQATELVVCIADVLDEPHMRRILTEHKPEVVFHAAAYKHVPLMEAQPGAAVKNIVRASRQLADLACETGVDSFVMISTDKAVNPTSVMGACKRAAELYVQSQAAASHCRFVTVRFGNVLDSAGSVVQVFREQIARGGPVTVTDPRMERFFMTIPEAARLVIQAGAIGGKGEILLLDMGEPVRIVDLAADMIGLSGLEVGRDIEIEFTGVRPGEKLFEELHLAAENLLPTRHPKIMVVDNSRRDSLAVIHQINQLIEAADGPREQLLSILGQLVPPYAENRAAAQRAA